MKLYKFEDEQIEAFSDLLINVSIDSIQFNSAIASVTYEDVVKTGKEYKRNKEEIEVLLRRHGFIFGLRGTS